MPVSATLATWFLIVKNQTLHRVEDASLAIFIFVLSSGIVVYLAYSAQRNLRLARRAGLKLTSLHEASHFGLVLTDASGRFLEFNETFTRLTGYTPSELRALDYLALTPKQYLAEEEQQLAVLNSTGHYGPFEKEYIRKDGTLVAVQVQGAFYRDPDGDRVLCSVVEDISGRRQAQAKIKQLADEQRAMIENPAAGIIKLTDRRMIWVNDTFATMLGYRAEELIGQTTRCLYPSDDAFRAFEADGYAKIEAHGSANLEVEFRHRNGSPVFLKCGMARLNGSQNTYVGVFSDRTEQHAAQRSLELAKARLQDAQRLAQIGSWEMDHTTGRLSWSEEMFALYGVPPTTSAPPDHTHLQNLHPADRPMTEDAFSSALDSGCPLDFTHRVILPNHTIIYVHVTEQRVRTVFAAMREGLVVQQRDGRIVQANDSAARLLGVTTDQLLGQISIDPRSDALRDDDSSFPAENHPWTVAMQTGQPALEVTMGVRLPAGKVRWLSVDAHPLMNSGSSDAEAVVVTFTDITERRQRDGDVRRLAFYDELTSLPTRHLLEDRLSQALAATKRNKEFMALMMLDLDNFKPLNDRHGHLVGDLLLKECAARLSRSVRAAVLMATEKRVFLAKDAVLGSASLRG
ncbi:MAG: PAS domain S-box protein [Proteobacteria bacterium]|nr:PAS domain S-box protein [Pseudomonadota bacterium]